jgi:hypothetical protein
MVCLTLSAAVCDMKSDLAVPLKPANGTAGVSSLPYAGVDGSVASLLALRRGVRAALIG